MKNITISKTRLDELLGKEKTLKSLNIINKKLEDRNTFLESANTILKRALTKERCPFPYKCKKYDECTRINCNADTCPDWNVNNFNQ